MNTRLVKSLLLLATALASLPALAGQNPALEEHATPILQRELAPEQYDDWVTHKPNTLGLEMARTIKAKTPGAAPQFANATVGEIFVVEGNNNLVLSINQQGAPCTGSNCYKVLNTRGGAMESIANQVLQSLGNQFDMIVIWTTFEDANGGAFYAPLRNDTYGLGKCQSGGGQDQIFGCEFGNDTSVRAQGLIFMNAVEAWKYIDQQWQLPYGEEDFNSQIYATLGQESAHRWLVGFHINDPRTGRDSAALLGRDRSHWNLKVDAQASVMDGLDWEDMGDNNFQIVGDNDGYSPIDLYAMGLMGAGEVPPFFIVEDAFSQDLRNLYRQYGQDFSGYIPDGNDELFIPPLEVIGRPIAATGSKLEVTIDMITASNGSRDPDVNNAPKVFNQAFVLVTLPGQSVAAAQPYIDQLERVRNTWERWFSSKTQGRGTMCTSLSGTCDAPQAEIVDLRLQDSDGVISRGEEVQLYLRLSNTGGRSIQAVSAMVSGAGLDMIEGGIQLTDIPAASEIEGVTPFRVRLNDAFDCNATSINVHVSLDPVGVQPDGRDFTFNVGPCAGGSGGDGSGGDDGNGNPLAIGSCGCSGTTPDGTLLMALGMLALVRRRR